MARGSYNHMQQIGDAFKDARMSSRMMNQARELDELGNLLSRLDMITNAMWELLQDNGITREMLYKKMDELDAALESVSVDRGDRVRQRDRTE